MKKIDSIFIAFVVASGLALAFLKADTAALTTDEALSFNHWISGGLHTILTDYSAFNNQILQTALSRISINIIGETELAQRLPSILAYVLFALVFVKLVEASIRNRLLRLIAISLVLLHPYIIDFAALARGYMLMMALNTVGVYLIVESFDSSRPRRHLLFLALASYAVGMSAATLPSAIRLLPGFLIVLLMQPMTNVRMKLRTVHLAAALLPAVVLIMAFYIPTLGSTHNLRIDLGTKSMIESLQSLRMIFFYTPSAVLDAGGNPALHPESMVFWCGQTTTQWINLFLAGKTVFVFFVAAITCVVILPFRYRSGREAFTIHMIWVTVLALILVERYVSGSRLPVGRAWLALAPFPVISAFSLVECLITRVTVKSQTQILALAGVLAALLIFVRINSFNVIVYQEWPDNSVSAAVVEELEDLVPPGRTASISCPFYYATCLDYYLYRARLSGIVVLPFHEAPATYYLLREDLLAKPMPEGLIVARYPNLPLVLARDKTTPIEL